MNGASTNPVQELCPVCGKQEATEAWQQESVPFGSENPVELQVQVPVMTCRNCGFSFTDDRAAAIRHDEVCRYQGLITPGEIKRIREDIYGMSRRDFEKVFGTSEASLERWENRKLFPSRQASTLLRLLVDRSIGQRVIEQSRHTEYRAETDVPRAEGVVQGRFRALTDSPGLRARAREFKLRISADQLAA